MSQNWYYPLKADQCSIEKYEELELENGFLAPVDGCSKLGDYSQGSKDFLFQELKKSLIEGVKNQEIKIKFISENTQEIELKNLSEARLVEVEEVKKWFKKHNFSSPFFESLKTPEGLPPYLDKNNLEHAAELRIAIEAWQRFSGLGLSHPNKYVKKWLTEFYGQKKSDDSTKELVTKNGIGRIVTLVNWRKKGGVGNTGNSKIQQSIYQQALDKNLS